MNRSLTNAIRWMMDELVPAGIRDSRVFMWPFYCLAYKTLKPAKYMRFKSNVWTMGSDDYADFYRSLNSVSRNRLTDNNHACVEQIVADSRDAKSVLDVGCGLGYLLNRLREESRRAELTGVDLLNEVPGSTFSYHQASADALPFPDNAFDVVLCTHVIEHVIDPTKVVRELLRVAREKVIIVTPRQRPFYYTLDEHINFFFYAEQLGRLAPGLNSTTRALSGDWYMVIRK
ncbi:class I SAM-dependent methyltransferase [Dyella soli]|uniref:SAM-dependent methyltransferase n=1 Tax=Dyella soli TaxID=522319 RepID=A0A4R0YWV7_9GAMM|nr:class I SAM-dependent methyltransferase [Dyella soli]TCI11122.1 SAM-dependent methyltransferase [Dyella soli]